MNPNRRNGQQVVQNHCQVSRIGAPIFEEVIVTPREIKAAVWPLESQEIVVCAVCPGIVARNFKLACSRKSLGENSGVIRDITMLVAALEVGTSVLCLPFAQKAQQSSNQRPHGIVTGEVKLTHQIQALKRVVLEPLEMRPDFATLHTPDGVGEFARCFLYGAQNLE